MDFQQEIEKHNLVIRNFDEFLAQKADRTSIANLYQYCDEKFELKGELGQNQEQLQKQITENTSEIKTIKDSLLLNLQNMKKKLSLEVQNATHHLKSSYLEYSAPSATAESKPNAQMVSSDLQQILNRKVNVQDFQDQLSNKIDKNAFIALNE